MKEKILKEITRDSDSINIHGAAIGLLDDSQILALACSLAEQKLAYINLSNYAIGALSLNNLKALFSKMKQHVTHLDLSYTDISIMSIEQLHQLSEGLGQFEMLQSIKFKAVGLETLTDEAEASMFSALAKIATLQEIDLTDNYFSLDKKAAIQLLLDTSTIARTISWSESTKLKFAR